MDDFLSEGFDRFPLICFKEVSQQSLGIITELFFEETAGSIS